MAIRMRYGLESEFDPDKMVVGEWAVSTDMKYVRMCFAPGIVARMATYEAFEADMVKVQELVSTAQSLKDIVMRLASEVGSNTTIVLEATEESKKYMEEAKKYSELAFATTPEGYEVLVKDVDLLKNSIVQTTYRTLYGSKDGGIKLIGIGGASEQGENPSPEYPQEIESVGDSGSLVIKQVGKNLFDIYADNLASIDFARYELHLKPNTTYTLSSNTPAFKEATSLYFNGGSSAINGVCVNNPKTTTTDGEGFLYIGVRLRQDIAYTETLDLYSAVKEGTYWIQLEEGETATTYEPYHSNTITIPLSEPLRGIGDIKDEVVCKDGVWGVERNVKSVVLDGSEDEPWAMLIGGGYPTFRTVASDGVQGDNAKCSHFIHGTVSSYDTNGVGKFELYGTYLYFQREPTAITTETEWRAWLSENPITVEYELATPVFEPFTDQTPFYQMQSYDTVTYISTDSKVEPSIEVKYAKTEGDAITLGNYNRTMLNEIHISELMALQTELAAALVAGSEV